MPRPIDLSRTYKVSIHAYSNYRYASTQPAFIDPDTGKRFYRRIHWGTVTEDLRNL